MTIRSWAKTIIAYTIEGEYKVYRIRKTSCMTMKKYVQTKLCLIIIWETDMDVIQSMY